MYTVFRTIVDSTGLSESSGAILLAVSGGMDSMCMASLFAEAGLKFAVAHCNFHLRGEESDADEALVRSWTEKSGVVFHKKDFDTLAFARSLGISTEMAARELRYRWFAGLCREHGYKFLAVAHNANDNAETLILNMVRGTGMTGLTGMQRLAPIPYSEDSQAVLVRPILQFTRKQIEAWVMKHSVPYRNDSTNFESEYKRNKLRNIVFPVLEQLNPSVVRTLNREMIYFSQASAIAKSYCDSRLAGLLSGEGMALDLAGLMAEPHRDYILYEWLSSFGFNSSVIASVSELLSKDGTVSGKFFRSSSYELLTTHDRLIVRPLYEGKPQNGSDHEQRISESCIEIGGAGEYEFNGLRFKVEVLDRDEVIELKQPEGILLFDAVRLTFPFWCRKWEAGDWFRPLGSRGRKKVSDFFTDLKYDRYSKEAAVVTVSEPSQKNISSVLGKRINDSFKVCGTTVRIVKISVL